MAVLLALVALTASAPNVVKMLLRPDTQVGKGYNLVERTDGFGVKGTVTLDLCGRTGYPSEHLRVARIQVNYLKAGDPRKTLGLSNEVVAYKPGGAQQAMREVLRHAASCPNRPIDTGQAGLPKLLMKITPIKDPNLLKGYVAVRVRVTGTVKGKRVDETSYAVYQRLGNVLSGVYSFGPNTPAQQRFVLHAAEQSAANLRKALAPGGPTA